MPLTLPQDPIVLPGDATDTAHTVCGHLHPVLQHLQSHGAKIASCQTHPENGWRTVVLDEYFYKGEMESRFAFPDFVEWSYADPHYGDGNSLNCRVCRCSLQARFDPHDPDRTIGEGR